ncbi:hypothetical protein J2X16_004882 [Pelomonas aquatica]|uniref:Pyocin activator protein PrtN n=1 Tax=Pelomonas aquatica TaxID=431058 RepID=A0ABU1ZFV1_9BURK|nr:hypothetical protein [Pelomonas aquatica]MDR7299512.1 hypothetical protein [Pelomonas aquatica]
MTDVDNKALETLKLQLRHELEQLHGPLLGGQKLIAALGHGNAASLRQARRRERVPVPLFTLPSRRGFFALTRDVADWLAQARFTAVSPSAPQLSTDQGELSPDQPDTP